MKSLVYIVILAAVASMTGFAGCREIPVDKTYALWIDHRPTEADWGASLPREVVVRGGRPHKLQSFIDIDDDTVHATTASCHHGSRIPDPVTMEIRAFYTDHDLYLRVSWPDETRDQSMRDWVFNGQGWENSDAFEDGFGILWDTSGSYRNFSCAYACHITDFGVSKENFHAANKMKLNREKTRLDLWNWKAARTGLLGFADDRYLDIEGMHGDEPGDLSVENSRVANEDESMVSPFSDEDAPLFDAEMNPIDAKMFSEGEIVPGYLTQKPDGRRADIRADAKHEAGKWVVTMKRALDTGDDRDVVFVPGDEVGVAFGVALMDHSLYEHYASKTHERLVLMAPGKGVPRSWTGDRF